MGCIDVCIPISYADTPRNIQMYRGAWEGIQMCGGHLDIWVGNPHVWGHMNYGGCTDDS